MSTANRPRRTALAALIAGLALVLTACTSSGSDRTAEGAVVPAPPRSGVAWPVARSGFQVNVQAPGWGTGNTFDQNTADVRGDGYGYELRRPTDEPAAGNRVLCTNTATAAAEGITNATCTPNS